MSIVRVNENEAPLLIDAFASNGQLVTDTITDLSPLMAEALTLLEHGGQNPLYGPIPALTTVATDLRAESRDLAWRLDWITQHDATNIPDSLATALESKGLDTGQQQQAQRWMLAGLTFTEAVDQANKERFDEKWAMFRRQEAESWSASPPDHTNQIDSFRRQEAQTTVERTPLDQARHSLEEIRVVLDSAKHDRDRHIGATVSDGIWSTEDLDAMIKNEDGFYTATQVAHAVNVQKMIELSPDAREQLGITESGGGWTISDYGHVALDVAGMVPVVGNAADGVNAAWYVAEGEWLDAALSSLALIPAFGQAVMMAKPAVKAAANGMIFRNIDEAIIWARQWLEGAGVLGRSVDEGVEATVRGADSAANRATHQQYVDELRRIEVEGTPGPSGARSAADDALRNGQTNGAAAQFDVNGQSYIDVSGSSTPLDPTVQRVLDDIPQRQRAPWHEGCAEPRCVSQALAAGADPSQGTMNAVQIGSNSPAPHGNLRPACPSCEALRIAFGYSQ